ncbi:MAG: bifunctional nuclease family protein [Chitinivibrionales bacterium]|nr:bifunctional nuclease family protein [Chitinivibrionales bacterium]
MLIKVEIVSFALESSQNIPLILVREVFGSRTIPIAVGAAEASIIALKSLNIASQRPLTIDLVLLIIQELGATVDKVVIHDMEDQVFYAHIYLVTAGKTWHVIDCRPSDALCLALRCGAAIFVDDHIFDKIESRSGRPKNEKLREYISQMDTMNFGTYYLG